MAWQKTDIPNCIWPTDNDLDIPVLRLDLMADTVDLPIAMWGVLPRRDITSKRRIGTLGFYVDDYRFTGLWRDASPVLNTGCVTLIEPNFSVHPETPRAEAMFLTYKKRWLSRLYQEFGGIRVFADLNVAERHADVNLLGVPAGWRAYASRGYYDKLPELDTQYELACERRGSRDVLFVVYGGGNAVRAHCLSRHWLWVEEQRTAVRRAKRAAEKGEPVPQATLDLEEGQPGVIMPAISGTFLPEDDTFLPETGESPAADARAIEQLQAGIPKDYLRMAEELLRAKRERDDD